MGLPGCSTASWSCDGLGHRGVMICLTVRVLCWYVLIRLCQLFPNCLYKYSICGQWICGDLCVATPPCFPYTCTLCLFEEVKISFLVQCWTWLRSFCSGWLSKVIQATCLILRSQNVPSLIMASPFTGPTDSLPVGASAVTHYDRRGRYLSHY